MAQMQQELAPSQAQLERKKLDGYASDERTLQIAAYFARYERPAAEYADIFVYYGDKYGVDPYVVAALAQLETSGFANDCDGADPMPLDHYRVVTEDFASPVAPTVNGFGWNSPGDCKPMFTSYEEAIAVVTWNLAGLNENTIKYYHPEYSLEKKIGYWNSVRGPLLSLSYWCNAQDAQHGWWCALGSG